MIIWLSRAFDASCVPYCARWGLLDGRAKPDRHRNTEDMYLVEIRGQGQSRVRVGLHTVLCVCIPKRSRLALSFMYYCGTNIYPPVWQLTSAIYSPNRKCTRHWRLAGVNFGPCLLAFMELFLLCSWYFEWEKRRWQEKRRGPSSSLLTNVIISLRYGSFISMSILTPGSKTY